MSRCRDCGLAPPLDRCPTCGLPRPTDDELAPGPRSPAWLAVLAVAAGALLVAATVYLVSRLHAA
jgi:hypothetical protein